MSGYDRLATTAFNLRPDGIERLQGGHWAMDFPRLWLEPITRLLRDLSHREHHSVPILRLNQAIRGLVPDVVAVGRNVHRVRNTGGWLYSTADIDPRSLEPILHAWIPTLHRALGREQADELWCGLPMADLAWRRIDDGELGWPIGPAAAALETPEATTAIAGLPGPLFHLIPELLAAALLRRSDRPVGFPRGFRRCPTTDGQGVELVSWPPLGIGAGGDWPYSYLVTLSIQTLPFVPEPRLNLEVGVRRWWPRTPANSGRNISMYLLTAVPWLRGLHNSSSFHVAPVRWRRDEQAWMLAWQKEVADILRQVHLDRPLPEPAEVGSNALSYLDGDPAAALVYATSSGRQHEAQAGASARDRDRIVAWVREGLEDVLEPVAPLERVRFRMVGARADAEALVRRAAVASTLGEGRTLRVDLRTDTEAVRDALLKAVTTDLGLDAGAVVQTAGGRCWETEELTLILREQPIGPLASELDLDGVQPRSSADRRERIRRAVHRRRRELASQEGAAAGRTVAIVEIQERDAFEAGADPKPALRLGLADTGRLSQFINPVGARGSELGLRHRAESAWADALRQVSGRILPLRPQVHGAALPDPVDHLAIWMVRSNATRSSWDKHRLPVAVWTSSDRSGAWARAFGMREWRSYPDLLLEVAAHQSGDSPPDCDERSVSGFVEDVLCEVQHDRPVLLLTCAQNLRDGWRWLANGRMMIDHIGFGDTTVPIGDLPCLRHVRVRLGSDHETPECYGVGEDGFGLPSGLWRIPGTTRTFASTMSRPDSARRHGSPTGSRIEARETKDGGLVVEDRKPAWNPSFVEFTAAAIQEGDDPVTWVALAHAMRRVSETYAGDLALPVQLQLAALVREYAMPGTEDTDLPNDDSVSKPDS